MLALAWLHCVPKALGPEHRGVPSLPPTTLAAGDGWHARACAQESARKPTSSPARRVVSPWPPASRRTWSPRANWVATIHHGLPLDRLPFIDRQGTYLAFVGRVTPEKGVAEAIELARRTNVPLRMAAKVYDRLEQEHFAEVVQPAIDEGIVTFLGELAPPERDALYAGAVATIMLGAWPEPFGLVAIESMATGTPVIARRAAAQRRRSSTTSRASSWTT